MKNKTRVTFWVFGRVYDWNVTNIFVPAVVATVHTFGGTVFTRKETKG